MSAKRVPEIWYKPITLTIGFQFNYLTGVNLPNNAIIKKGSEEVIILLNQKNVREK